MPWSTRPVAAGLILALALTSCASSSAGSAPVSGIAEPPTAATEPRAPTSSAQVQLAALAVKGRAPKTGYSRQQFGPAWADVDRNGCDTRNDTLRRDLRAVTVDPSTRGCVVLTGTLDDPYSGTPIPFTRGQASSSAVQVDHVVALGDSWQTGAQQLDAPARLAFANDPLNLLAVSGVLNQQKSDSDAASWLPPNKAFRCGYVTRQIEVKVKYALWVTAAEKAAMTTVLGACPVGALGNTRVASSVQPTPPPTSNATTAQTPAPAAVPAPLAPVPAPGRDGYYPNCTAAKQAGAAPLRRGEPGYRAGLDRDNDGIACEK